MGVTELLWRAAQSPVPEAIILHPHLRSKVTTASGSSGEHCPKLSPNPFVLDFLRFQGLKDTLRRAILQDLFSIPNCRTAVRMLLVQRLPLANLGAFSTLSFSQAVVKIR
jgi:hypothetical protein